MKCKIFWGCVAEAQDAFNKWAKGKSLTREVIIHEQITRGSREEGTVQLVIIVYHPDTPEWNATKETKAQEEDITTEAIRGDP